MNQPLPELIEAIRRSLREDIRTELQSDHARSQLAGVIDILSKLERMLVWSPDVLHEKLAALQRSCAALHALATAHGSHKPAPEPWTPPATNPPLRHAELEEAVRTGEAWLVRLTDWLFDAEAQLPEAARREIDAMLRGALRELLAAERKLIPRTDFGSMTAGASQRAAEPSA